MCRPKFLQPNGAGGVIAGQGANGSVQPLQNLQQIRQFSGDQSLNCSPPPPTSPEFDRQFSTSRGFLSKSLSVAESRESRRSWGRSTRARSPSPSSRSDTLPRKASPSPIRSVAPQVQSQSQSEVDVTSLQRGVASCAGTVFMSIFMTPLDVVKVRLQAQQQPTEVIRSFRPVFSSHPHSALSLVPYRSYTCIPATHSHSHIICPSSTSAYRFSGTLDAFVKIVRSEGFCRLWSGLTPALLMRVPSNVIYFSVYEKLKSVMGFQKGHTDKNSFLITLSASGTARAVSVTTVSPIEMIRTKMQAEPTSYAQLMCCLRRAIMNDGLSSLWRGLGPMLSRDVMYAVLYWTHYELLKAEMCKISNVSDPTVAMTFWAGAASGVLAAVVSTPFDVVKTQKQITIGKNPGSTVMPRCKTSSLAIMRAIFAEAGMKGLFAGTVPRICKGAPSSAILITTYECVISLFQKYNLEKGYAFYWPYKALFRAIMPLPNDGHVGPSNSVVAARVSGSNDDAGSHGGRPAMLATGPSPLPPLTPVQQMISSGTGAFLTALFMTPLDVVKIRLQSQIKPIASGQCFLYCNGLMDHLCTCINGKEPMNMTVAPWYKRPGQFNGTLDALFKIAKNEGIAKLWSGLPPTLLMAVPATVLYYTSYDQLKELMGYQFGKSSLLIPMASGGIARVFAVTVISPLELVRTKMQSKPLTYNEIVGCIKTAVQDEGWLSLWRGLGPTLLRDVPFSMILWANYEFMKTRACLKYNRREPTFPAAFFSGAVSGILAAVLTNPFDVVKTHRQIELGEAMFNTKKDGNYRATSTWNIMQRLYAERGLRGLFAGIFPRIAKVTPACALMISTYELGKAFFHKRNEAIISQI
ncbi:uncharacterized protein LOC110974546 [Acanthaster planci]|uniref:Uncharacterized protein LOC110974546 n=1 Tax=Acanthaster planci TaxID=133434 RepID=A0A8B7XPQ7_ACAPL|nr:uncharacterized protein LOC110974546 [Acanthaster planci]